MQTAEMGQTEMSDELQFVADPISSGLSPVFDKLKLVGQKTKEPERRCNALRL